MYGTCQWWVLASSWRISLADVSYEATFDTAIITDVVTNYFSGKINIAAPYLGAALPIVQGLLIDSASYSDSTFREIMNSLTDQSGYTWYLDFYYTLRYQPPYYSVASFALSSSPDNVSTFAYHDYLYEKDGTQIKNRIKVVGGKFIAPAITDQFNGNGSNTVFNLSHGPYNISGNASVGGSGQKTGISGVNKLNVGGYLAIVDKAKATLTFQNAPASGTNNVTITYTYETPVVVVVESID